MSAHPDREGWMALVVIAGMLAILIAVCWWLDGAVEKLPCGGFLTPRHCERLDGGFTIPAGTSLSINNGTVGAVVFDKRECGGVRLIYWGCNECDSGCRVEYCDGGVVKDDGPFWRAMQEVEEAEDKKAVLWRREHP